MLSILRRSQSSRSSLQPLSDSTCSHPFTPRSQTSASLDCDCPYPPTATQTCSITMLCLQLLSVAVALFTFTAPSLCDTLEVLNPPHPRIGIPSIDFQDGLAQHISSDFAASMQNLPLNHGLKPTRAMKRGPKILEYKLVKPKSRGNAKRADGDNSPALFSFPNCLVCTGKRKDDMGLTVRDNFQADQMVGMMLLGGMSGECLFCRLPRQDTIDAQRPPGVTYLPKVTSLSRLTTAYSCQSGGRYRTIWVSLRNLSESRR
jgi:hypothetical protein